LVVTHNNLAVLFCSLQEEQRKREKAKKGKAAAEERRLKEMRKKAMEDAEEEMRQQQAKVSFEKERALQREAEKKARRQKKEARLKEEERQAKVRVETISMFKGGSSSFFPSCFSSVAPCSKYNSEMFSSLSSLVVLHFCAHMRTNAPNECRRRSSA